MESSTSSQPNQPYSLINPTNLDMNFEELIFSQDYNYSQYYSMGHGSGHGSASGSAHGSTQGSVPFHDDEDDSPVEEVSPVKPKKPSRPCSKRSRRMSPRRSRRRQRNGQWRKRLRCAKGRKKSKTSETTSGSAYGGLNLNEEADEDVEETQEFRPMGRDRAKAKKKAVGSSRGGASSFVDLVADKFCNMKQKKGKKDKEQQSYIELKNRELSIREAEA
ncbi:hypothetical protein Tco_0574057 [Tanacetum coccineum]